MLYSLTEHTESMMRTLIPLNPVDARTAAHGLQRGLPNQIRAGSANSVAPAISNDEGVAALLTRSCVVPPTGVWATHQISGAVWL